MVVCGKTSPREGSGRGAAATFFSGQSPPVGVRGGDVSFDRADGGGMPCVRQRVCTGPRSGCGGSHLIGDGEEKENAKRWNSNR